MKVEQFLNRNQFRLYDLGINILQSYNNQNSMVLALRQTYRTIQQNSESEINSCILSTDL